MTGVLNFLRSLVIASLFSFMAPLVIAGLVFVGFVLLGHLPYVDAIGQVGNQHVLDFLAKFGNGQPLRGLLIISTTCGLVGALFDAFAFYRYQTLRGN